MCDLEVSRSRAKRLLSWMISSKKRSCLCHRRKLSSDRWKFTFNGAKSSLNKTAGGISSWSMPTAIWAAAAISGLSLKAANVKVRTKSSGNRLVSRRCPITCIANSRSLGLSLERCLNKRATLSASLRSASDCSLLACSIASDVVSLGKSR